MSVQEFKPSMTHYKLVELTLADAQYALNNFKELKPRMKPYTTFMGAKNLLTLDGTIPVTYKGKVYNIPIIVWLLDTHPSDRPMVQVQPTSSMTIRPGPNVDPSGNVMVPYLSEWKMGQADITTLLQILTVMFGEAPPVFSKSRNQAAQPTTSSTPPPYPPYSASAMPQPYQQPSTSAAPYPTINFPGSSSAGYPPTSAAKSTYPVPYPPNSNTPVYNPYGPSGGYPPSSYPSSTAAGQVPYPPASSSGGYPPASTAASGYSLYPVQQPPTTYQNPATSTAQVSLATAAVPGSAVGYQLSEEEIKRSLLSAVEDKMRRQICDIVSTNKAEMEVLRDTQKNLMDGQTKLEQYERNLKTEMDECGKTISILENKIPMLRSELEKRSGEEQCPPEEAIHTTAPLYKQLLSLYAEEQATEDALYILGDSLRREVISIELYLKKVRDLSRRQFMLRALIQKCREKAGLSDIYN